MQQGKAGRWARGGSGKSWRQQTREPGMRGCRQKYCSCYSCIHHHKVGYLLEWWLDDTEGIAGLRLWDASVTSKGRQGPAGGGSELPAGRPSPLSLPAGEQEPAVEHHQRCLRGWRGVSFGPTGRRRRWHSAAGVLPLIPCIQARPAADARRGPPALSSQRLSPTRRSHSAGQQVAGPRRAQRERQARMRHAGVRAALCICIWLPTPQPLPVSSLRIPLTTLLGLPGPRSRLAAAPASPARTGAAAPGTAAPARGRS